MKLVEIDEDLYRFIVDRRQRVDEKFTDSLRQVISKVKSEEEKRKKPKKED